MLAKYLEEIKNKKIERKDDIIQGSFNKIHYSMFFEEFLNTFAMKSQTVTG